MLQRLVFVLIASFTLAQKEIDQALKTGFEALQQSLIPGQTTRQCSCYETNECVKNMTDQVLSCGQSCWYHFSNVTQRTDLLRTCLDNKKTVLENFLNCSSNVFDPCVNAYDGPQIPKRNFTEMLRIGETNVVGQRQALLSNTVVQPLQNLVETVFRFGKCVKDCFVNGNAQGYCFDRRNCQPLITEQHARKALRACVRGLDWKAEAGELCDCALGAGVRELANFCPTLRLLNHRRGG